MVNQEALEALLSSCPSLGLLAGPGGALPPPRGVLSFAPSYCCVGSARGSGSKVLAPLLSPHYSFQTTSSGGSLCVGLQSPSHRGSRRSFRPSLATFLHSMPRGTAPALRELLRCSCVSASQLSLRFSVALRSWSYTLAGACLVLVSYDPSSASSTMRSYSRT